MCVLQMVRAVFENTRIRQQQHQILLQVLQISRTKIWPTQNSRIKRTLLLKTLQTSPYRTWSVLLCPISGQVSGFKTRPLQLKASDLSIQKSSRVLEVVESKVPIPSSERLQKLFKVLKFRYRYLLRFPWPWVEPWTSIIADHTTIRIQWYKASIEIKIVERLGVVSMIWWNFYNKSLE